MKVLPTLRQLRYLVAVAEHRHFGRAAEDCFVTQSTLSAGIQELEAILGINLIVRSKRLCALTPLGEEVVARAQALLRQAEELVDVAQAGGKPLSGLVRLGVIPTIGPYLLPRALPAVRAVYPELKLYLREEQTARLLELLTRGRLDGAVIALPYDTTGLHSMPLGDDGLMIACPPGHRLARAAEVRTEDLRGEPLLLLEDGHCLRDHALTACRLLPGQANEDFQATSLGTLVQMVASGLGATLLPEMAVTVETRREPNIVVRPLADPGPTRQIALVWRAGSPRAADLTLLGSFLRAELPSTTTDNEPSGVAATPTAR